MAPIRRVFWADDSRPDQLLIRISVMELALPVKVAAFDRGSSLLAQLKKSRPSLVVLDVGMPGMDGIETLRRIRASGSDVPVVIFSTACTEPELQACLELGIEEYYVKPGPFPEYMETVRSILDCSLDPAGDAAAVKA